MSIHIERNEAAPRGFFQNAANKVDEWMLSRGRTRGSAWEYLSGKTEGINPLRVSALATTSTASLIQDVLIPSVYDARDLGSPAYIARIQRLTRVWQNKYKPTEDEPTLPQQLAYFNERTYPVPNGTIELFLTHTTPLHQLVDALNSIKPDSKPQYFWQSGSAYKPAERLATALHEKVSYAAETYGDKAVQRQAHQYLIEKGLASDLLASFEVMEPKTVIIRANIATAAMLATPSGMEQDPGYDLRILRDAISHPTDGKAADAARELGRRLNSDSARHTPIYEMLNRIPMDSHHWHFWKGFFGTQNQISRLLYKQEMFEFLIGKISAEAQRQIFSETVVKLVLSDMLTVFNFLTKHSDRPLVVPVELAKKGVALANILSESKRMQHEDTLETVSAFKQAMQFHPVHFEDKVLFSRFEF